jgi:hypothetical protein
MNNDTYKNDLKIEGSSEVDDHEHLGNKYVYMDIYIYMYMYIYVYICMYIYVYI